MLGCDSTAVAIEAAPVNLMPDLPLVTATRIPNLTHGIDVEVSDWAITQCIDCIKVLLCTLKSTLKL